MYDLESLFGDDDNSGSGESSGGSKHVYSQPHQKRPENGFVGLVNLYVLIFFIFFFKKKNDFIYILYRGATCYLNSMLQMLYMTPGMIAEKE